MRGDILYNVLEGIGDAVLGVADVFAVFLEAGYGASRGKLEYGLRQRERQRTLASDVIEERTTQRYHALIYKLKKDGLLEKRSKGHNAKFFLTGKGKKKLVALKEFVRARLPKPAYPKEKSIGATIVTFDIPEKERKKRDWLREALVDLNMKMVQKSVWIGKIKIPKALLSDLRELRIIEYVEIFEVTKKGSLSNIA